MPLYDFDCSACGMRFEARAAPGQIPPCPACQSNEARRVLTPFAGPFKIGLRGVAARRSNTQRRARAEQRREQRERRRQQREHA